jgi:hypothetical protein
MAAIFGFLVVGSPTRFGGILVVVKTNPINHHDAIITMGTHVCGGASRSISILGLDTSIANTAVVVVVIIIIISHSYISPDLCKNFDR